jgi:uncharacterized protein
MRTSQGDLPDANVLVALALPYHHLHPPAAEYWKDESASRIYVCQITGHAYLRHLTNPHITNGKPATPLQAWREYQRLLALSEVTYVKETDAAGSVIESWVTSGVFTPRMWSDVHIAAYAKVFGLRVITFDRDFLKFPDLDVLLLKSPAPAAEANK